MALGEAGDSYSNLSRFYNEFARDNVLDDWDMNRYISYLTNTKLIESANPTADSHAMRFKISDVGVLFLSRVKSAHAQEWQKKLL